MLKLIKIPTIVERLFPSIIWNKSRNQKTLYLTFDDGPCEELSLFILDELKKYKAKATFFYLGSQVDKFPNWVEKCQKENHSIGNHTFSHLNGWASTNNVYFEDVEKANRIINSNLFRPPYGRIKPSQLFFLKKQYKIVMWDVLSWDFDKDTTPQECYDNILKHTNNGSIIVLHENEKSAKNVKEVLPKILRHYTSLGYEFKAL